MSEVTVITLPARFGFQHHVSFTESYEAFIASSVSTSLQLNFSKVTFLDTSALGMLTLLAKKSRASNASMNLEITGENESTGEMLKIANMGKHFRIK
ncbi:STAS domain-containing protein [Reinekea sp.]|uniref:STAS domain-containing protein n=1 Tax=Reinekea sp. TaxID=1970455 RepID=UPI002A838A19|nr:STAS domain-containing protein [Reinekea sp.]